MSSLMDQVQGHQQIKAHLCQLLACGKLPPNMLFLGPSGVGKFHVALAVAQQLVCEKQMACGVCGPCFRVARRQSESLYYIQPEKNVIRIEIIRNMIHFLHLKALGRAKVIIIRDAQCLNPQASNALLKTLEDPPQVATDSLMKTYFIFITHHRGSLMPTLGSRLQSTSFAPLSYQDLRKIKKEEDVSEWVLKSCQGRVDLLDQLIEKAHLRKEALEIFQKMFQQKVSSAFLKIQQQKVMDRRDALWLTTYIGQFLRDVLILKLGHTDLMHTDLEPVFEKVLDISYQVLLELFEYVMEMSYSIESYVDKTLLFEQMVLRSFRFHLK